MGVKLVLIRSIIMIGTIAATLYKLLQWFIFDFNGYVSDPDVGMSMAAVSVPIAYVAILIIFIIHLYHRPGVVYFLNAVTVLMAPVAASVLFVVIYGNYLAKSPAELIWAVVIFYVSAGASTVFTFLSRQQERVAHIRDSLVMIGRQVGVRSVAFMYVRRGTCWRLLFSKYDERVDDGMRKFIDRGLAGVRETTIIDISGSTAQLSDLYGMQDDAVARTLGMYSTCLLIPIFKVGANRSAANVLCVTIMGVDGPVVEGDSAYSIINAGVGAVGDVMQRWGYLA